MLYLVKSTITSSQEKPDTEVAPKCGVQNQASEECGVCTDQIFVLSAESGLRARAGASGQAAASVRAAKGAFVVLAFCYA